MFDMIVMRVAGNELGPKGGECISRALMQLTGLQTLWLNGACSLCCFDGGVVCFAQEGGRE
jgi:hypothetical protein